jgi:hypothetical protein
MRGSHLQLVHGQGRSIRPQPGDDSAARRRADNWLGAIIRGLALGAIAARRDVGVAATALPVTMHPDHLQGLSTKFTAGAWLGHEVPSLGSSPRNANRQPAERLPIA